MNDKIYEFEAVIEAVPEKSEQISWGYNQGNHTGTGRMTFR